MEKKAKPIISFEEILKDKIIRAELEALYWCIHYDMFGSTDPLNVDDWECIIADRIATLLSLKGHDYNQNRKYARPIRTQFTWDENHGLE